MNPIHIHQVPIDYNKHLMIYNIDLENSKIDYQVYINGIIAEPRYNVNFTIDEEKGIIKFDNIRFIPFNIVNYITANLT